MQPTHLAIGRILSAHGTRGELAVEILTDFPDRFSLLKTVYLGEQLIPTILEGHRTHGGRVLLKLAGCENRDDAHKLRGQLIQVPIQEAMPLDDDEYYVHEIVGLDVVTTEGEYLGRIEEIVDTGSNDVYVVRRGGREILIPALSEVVLDVDLEEGRVEVRLMKGLR
jgi:16S rRNA processing protein RimM